MIEWIKSPMHVIHEMTESMIAKFEKYWGVIIGVMVVGIVLDPRYKVDLLDYMSPKFMETKLIMKLKGQKLFIKNW